MPSRKRRDYGHGNDFDRTTDIPLVEPVVEQFQYPGIPTTCDGAEAVVHVETRISQGCGAFPITSSTTMGGGFNAGRHERRARTCGAISSCSSSRRASTRPRSFCEGFAVAGGRVTNFTSGQGLVLMKEVLYTISGKRLPVVMNIGARALTSQGLNVHAGHDDVMSVADCGWGMLFARNAQEAGDLCLIARRAAEASQTPFFNVQDGFLTTHTVESVRLPEPEFMKEFIGEPEGQADEPDGPGQPDDVGRGAESGLVHEGQDRPALVLRPGRAGAAKRRSRSSTSKTGPAVRLRRCRTAATTPSTSSSAWAATWRRPRRRSITCARRRASRPAA